MFCRLVRVVPGAVMYKDIYVSATHEAQFVGLLEQDFPSAPELLLQQALRIAPLDCTALRHTRRTGSDKNASSVSRSLDERSSLK